MKRLGALAMAPFLSAVAVLLGAATAADVRHKGAAAQSSISQIRDTLKNLLRSIEDNGRDSETLFGKRQLWCDSNLHAFEAEHQTSTASLLDMQARLTETEAEVEEAAGTVEQVKVDIEMVQHTIKQTQGMLEERTGEGSHKADASLLQALVENKQMSLASLQGELEVAVPVLAQLQANVAETKQRISYRSQTLSAAKDFMSSLRESCQGSADRSDSQAAARVGESNSIHSALQALDQSGSDSSASKSSNDDEDKGAEVPDEQAVSFVQVAEEVTTDDLSDIFAADREAHPANYEDEAPILKTVTQAPMAATISLRPRIQTLLMQLKNVDSTSVDGSDQASWCDKQRESSMMALKFAQDSVAQIGSELESHADSEMEFGDDLAKLQQSASTIAATAKSIFQQAGKEQSLLQSSRKDQQLATKILDQAMTILKELGVSNWSKVVSDLDSGKKTLLAQIKASAGFEHDSSTKAKAVGEMALAFTKAQESEQHNLEFARDDHASQRLRGVENKRLYEADVEEAATYAKKLESSCSADAQSQAKKQRSLQVHALEDADKALDGKLVEAKPAASSLRGVDSSSEKPIPKNLTPMQRAAMEMGVSTD